MSTQREGIFGNITIYVLNNKWRVILLSILFTLLCSIGLKDFGFNFNYKIFFSQKEGSDLEHFEAFQEKYGKDDNVIIVLAPESKNVFEKETLGAIQELVDMVWLTPYSMQVDAITNYQHVRTEEGILYVDDLVPAVEGLLEGDFQEIKQITLNDQLLVNRLINKDGSVTGHKYHLPSG